ncbi:hypothetical protein OE810_00985 [Rhodobacteraceae bacterium XHP0102]|nr:hypothetical protein [Rhodobacteraceae bacterium XHP0102]
MNDIKLCVMVALLLPVLPTSALAENRLGFFGYERDKQDALLTLSSQWNAIDTYNTTISNFRLADQQSSEEQAAYGFGYSSASDTGPQLTFNLSKLFAEASTTATSSFTIAYETPDEKWLSGIRLSSTNPSNDQTVTSSTVLLSRLFEWSAHELRISGEATYLHDHNHLSDEVGSSHVSVSYEYDDTQHDLKIIASRLDNQSFIDTTTGSSDWSHSYQVSTQYLTRINQWRLGFTRIDTNQTDPRAGDSSSTHLNAIYDQDRWQVMATVGEDKIEGVETSLYTSNAWRQDRYALSYVYQLSQSASLIANATHLAGNQSRHVPALNLPNHVSVDQTSLSVQLMYKF